MLRFLLFRGVLILIGCSTLLRVAGQTPELTRNEKPALQPISPAIQPLSLVELGKLYQTLGLPLPPKDAFFVMYGCFNEPLTFVESAQEFHYQLHLATGGPYPKLNYQVWQCFKVYPRQKLEVVFSTPPKPETVLQYMKLIGLPGPSDREGAGYGELIFAIQCHTLGHSELSRYFYNRCIKQIHEPLNRSLVMLAWNYWAEELTNPKRDRAEVAEKLHFLVEKQGFFEILKTIEMPNDEGNQKSIKRHQDLLDRLDLTLRPVIAKPGSIEANIEDLLDNPEALKYPNSWFITPEPEMERNSNQENQTNRNDQKQQIHGLPPDTETLLRNKGFAAIPSLIDHVDDRRLVRQPIPGLFYGQGGPSGVITIESKDFSSVGKRVRKILSAFFDLDQEKATKADYLAAWMKMKMMTESEFVEMKLNKIQDLNYDFIKFVADKYKKEALNTYEIILSKSIYFKHIDVLLDLVVHSDLPRDAKIDLLERCAQGVNFGYKHSALLRLLEFDNAAFSRLYIESIGKLVWDKDGYSNDEIRVRIVGLFFRAEDRAARVAGEKYVKLLPVNQKLAVFKDLHIESHFESTGLKSLSFLCQFLDDTTLYQDPKGEKNGFRNLAYDAQEIEVRNFTAILILKNMGIEILPGNSESRWAEIREFTKMEVNRRLENMGRK